MTGFVERKIGGIEFLEFTNGMVAAHRVIGMTRSRDLFTVTADSPVATFLMVAFPDATQSDVAAAANDSFIRIPAVGQRVRVTTADRWREAVVTAVILSNKPENAGLVNHYCVRVLIDGKNADLTVGIHQVVAIGPDPQFVLVPKLKS